MKKTFTFLTLLITTAVFAGGGGHHIGVFVGQTSDTDFEHSENTFGIDYEYALPTSIFSIGAVAEFVTYEHTETILLGQVTLRPPALSLKLFAAAGFAFATHEDHVTHEETTESHFVMRVGTGYEFHLAKFTVSPTIALDRIDGHSTLVYGVTVGIGF